MAKKKTTPEAPAEDSALVAAAKTIGTAAGKVAAAVGATSEPQEPRKSTKIPKLKKKNKSRLPRKQKKAQKKAAAKARG